MAKKPGKPTKKQQTEFRSMARQIKDLPDQYIKCRNLMHHWNPLTARRIRGGWEEVVVCSCTAKRIRILDSVGMVVSSSIKYPPDFLMQGVGRVTGPSKGALRVETLRRLGAS